MNEKRNSEIDWVQMKMCAIKHDKELEDQPTMNWKLWQTMGGV